MGPRSLVGVVKRLIEVSGVQHLSRRSPVASEFMLERK